MGRWRTSSQSIPFACWSAYCDEPRGKICLRDVANPVLRSNEWVDHVRCDDPCRHRNPSSQHSPLAFVPPVDRWLGHCRALCRDPAIAWCWREEDVSHGVDWANTRRACAHTLRETARVLWAFYLVLDGHCLPAADLFWTCTGSTRFATPSHASLPVGSLPGMHR